MAPKAVTSNTAGEKTFKFEVMSLLLASIKKSNPGTIINYKLMSALSDGEFTASALEHQFRAVTHRSKQLLARYEEQEAKGEPLQAATPTPKRKVAGGMNAKRKGNSDDGEKPVQVSEKKIRTDSVKQEPDDKEVVENTSEIYDAAGDARLADIYGLERYGV